MKKEGKNNAKPKDFMIYKTFDCTQQRKNQR